MDSSNAKASFIVSNAGKPMKIENINTYNRISVVFERSKVKMFQARMRLVIGIKTRKKNKKENDGT